MAISQLRIRTPFQNSYAFPTVSNFRDWAHTCLIQGEDFAAMEATEMKAKTQTAEVNRKTGIYVK